MDHQRLSCYVLTRNAERYLAKVLEAIRPVCDELLAIDSGSTDSTRDICDAHGATVLYRPFENFRDQREYAQEQCRNLWVLALDADEVPTPRFVAAVEQLKEDGFRQTSTEPDAFQMERAWFVKGQPVHAFFPVKSPDFPIRLVRRDRVRYGPDADAVHAGPTGYRRLGRIEGVVNHYTCETDDELFAKLDFYTTMAARDMKRRGWRSTWARRSFAPVGAWLKWHVRKGGWRDGAVGRLLSSYAYRYTSEKYEKLSQLQQSELLNAPPVVSFPTSAKRSRKRRAGPCAGRRRRPKRPSLHLTSWDSPGHNGEEKANIVSDYRMSPAVDDRQSVVQCPGRR